MQYSAVIVALFAATALAAPAETFQAAQDSLVDAGEELSGGDAVDTTIYPDIEDPEYVPETDPEYVPETDPEYVPETETEYEAPSYEPTPQKCYTAEEKPAYGEPIYFAEDEEAYKQYEQYAEVEEFEYPKQIDAGNPCPITYKQKPTSSYKKHYKVAICKSTDGYKTCEDVCDTDESCKSYKVPETYVPSDDSKDGCMYRFKAYEADAPEKCTYSVSYPIYNPSYYEKNVDCKPEPTKCPPPVYAIPAKPVEPVTPVAPVEKPVAPVAPAPLYPVNETAPVDTVQPFDSGSSAIRASVSAIVGMAAIAIFAL